MKSAFSAAAAARASQRPQLAAGTAEGHGDAWIEGVPQLSEDDTAQVWQEQHAPRPYLVRQWIVGHSPPSTARMRPDLVEHHSIWTSLAASRQKSMVEGRRAVDETAEGERRGTSFYMRAIRGAREVNRKIVKAATLLFIHTRHISYYTRRSAAHKSAKLPTDSTYTRL